jgi:hypothetical protein
VLLQAGPPINYVSHQIGHRDASITRAHIKLEVWKSQTLYAEASHRLTPA